MARTLVTRFNSPREALRWIENNQEHVDPNTKTRNYNHLELDNDGVSVYDNTTVIHVPPTAPVGGPATPAQAIDMDDLAMRIAAKMQAAAPKPAS